MGGVICKLYIREGVNIKISKEFTQFNIKNKKKQPGSGSEQIFFQNTDGQQAHEKMLSTTNHQGSINQTHKEIPPHTCQNGYYQTDSK